MNRSSTLFAVAMLCACGQAPMQQMMNVPVCDADTCGGCCNGTRCETGTAVDLCGSSGGACNSCGAAQVCTAGACADSMQPPASRRIFITRSEYDGNLMQAGGGADGLAGADALCQRAADSVQLGGTWTAFLSTSAVDAISRITSAGPWVNLKGATVFHNKAGFLTGPLAAIEYDERGEATSGYDNIHMVGVPAAVWTGSTHDGVLAQWHNFDGFDEPATCVDWTSDPPNTVSGEYHVGNVGEGGDVTPRWMEGAPSSSESDYPCFSMARLYCFEK